jgi:acyl-CoA reductase-like NAD-dependent aldehyde dehydrogenase
MSKAKEPLRLDVRTTYKLFIDGEFVRSESERSEAVAGDDGVRFARASRDDLRMAVASAKTAFGGWSRAHAPVRGEALYRLAEALDARRAQLIERLRAGSNADETEAAREADAAIDRTLWYAGWCDKYALVASGVAPVAAPFVTYAHPIPLGVVAAFAPDEPSLLGIVAAAVPPLVAGNTVVVVASEAAPRSAIAFAECVAAAGLPAGTLNILTGRRIELAPHFAKHPDVAGLHAFGLDGPFAAELERVAADDLKRCRMVPQPSPAEWFSAEGLDLANVLAFTQTKTVWQPALI